MFNKTQLIIELLDNEYDRLEELEDEKIFDMYSNILLSTRNLSEQEKDGYKMAH